MFSNKDGHDHMNVKRDWNSGGRAELSYSEQTTHIAHGQHN